MNSDTVFALASGGLAAGVAVIRVSGPKAGESLRRLAGKVPSPRRATRVLIADGDEAIDDGLVLWFPGPASFTGEDVAEFHLHGGKATVARMLAALGGIPGLRMAEPGEFTRRAFENGKLDLTAAEGLADMVAAETEAQRRQAFRQMQGDLGRLYDGWRERLLAAQGHIEAAIDFSDQDLPAGVGAQVAATVAEVVAEIGAHLADGRRGERLRDGIHIAIVGAPNVGKSSLLNKLARRDAAIVSATAGTTRDVIEVHMDLGGYPVTIADTAGLREAGDAIEAEGVSRARHRAEQADLTIAVFDAQDWPRVDPATAELVDARTIPVLNKIDLKHPAGPIQVGDRMGVALSVATGQGFDALLVRLAAEAEARFGLLAAPSPTRERHRSALEACREALSRFAMAGSPELAAEDLRLAARALGRITGRVDVEEILDRIFAEFCIGK